MIFSDFANFNESQWKPFNSCPFFPPRLWPQHVLHDDVDVDDDDDDVDDDVDDVGDVDDDVDEDEEGEGGEGGHAQRKI